MAASLLDLQAAPSSQAMPEDWEVTPGKDALPDFSSLLTHMALFRPIFELCRRFEEYNDQIDPAAIFLLCLRKLNDNFVDGNSSIADNIKAYAFNLATLMAPELACEIRESVAHEVFATLANSRKGLADYSYSWYSAKDGKIKHSHFKYMDFKAADGESECIPVTAGLRVFRQLSAMPDSFYCNAVTRQIIDFIISQNPRHAAQMLGSADTKF